MVILTWQITFGPMTTGILTDKNFPFCRTLIPPNATYAESKCFELDVLPTSGCAILGLSY